MWQVKTFKTLEAQNAWIKRNEGNYQIVVIVVNNAYGVEYRKLRRVY